MFGSIQITQPNLLIVEGEEDKRFFESLSIHLGLAEIQVLPIGGKTKLRENLKGLRDTANFPTVRSLGIVRDADADPYSAFQSVCDALNANQLPAPSAPFIPIGHSPQVTILILPGDGKPGMLEDICLEAVQDQPAMICVREFFQCLNNHKISFPTQKIKAEIQVFLASIEPEIRVGEAAEKSFWPWNHAAFSQIQNFLRQIAGIA